MTATTFPTPAAGDCFDTLSASGWRIEYAALSSLAGLVVFYLSYSLARPYDYTQEHACWLAIAFVFGSSFVNCSLLPWGFAHSPSALCLFAAILQYDGKRRMAGVGVLIGVAMTSRAPAGLNIVCFLLAAVAAQDAFKLALPFGAFVAMLAVYNYARFGDPLETGYTYQVPFNTISFPGNIAGPSMSRTCRSHERSVSAQSWCRHILTILWRVKWDQLNKLTRSIAYLYCSRSYLFARPDSRRLDTASRSASGRLCSGCWYGRGCR